MVDLSSQCSVVLNACGRIKPGKREDVENLCMARCNFCKGTKVLYLDECLCSLLRTDQGMQQLKYKLGCIVRANAYS